MYIVNCFPQSTGIFYSGYLVYIGTTLTKSQFQRECFFKANTNVVSGNVQIRPSSMLGSNIMNGNCSLSTNTTNVMVYMIDTSAAGVIGNLTVFLYNSGGTGVPSNNILQKLVCIANNNNSTSAVYTEYYTATANGITVSGTTIRYLWNTGPSQPNQNPWTSLISAAGLGATTGLLGNATVGLFF